MMKKAKTTTKNKKEDTIIEEKLNPFDFVKSIQSTKKNIIRESTNPELAEKNYLPFITNKALSFHMDSIFYANDMNIHNKINNIYQYEYYLHSIRSMKRPHIWLKHEEDSKINLIKEYYKVNDEKAMDYLKILTDNDLNEIRKKIIIGGVNK